MLKNIKTLETFLFLKFPVVYLHRIMKEKILAKASELFLNLGFKSVTMDDIANELGISKKTFINTLATKLNWLKLQQHS